MAMSGETSVLCPRNVVSASINRITKNKCFFWKKYFPMIYICHTIPRRNGSIAIWLTNKVLPNNFQKKAMYKPKAGGWMASSSLGRMNEEKLVSINQWAYFEARSMVSQKNPLPDAQKVSNVKNSRKGKVMNNPCRSVLFTNFILVMNKKSPFVKGLKLMKAIFSF